MEYSSAGVQYMNWAAQMAVGMDMGVPWVMCKQDDAPDPVHSSDVIYNRSCPVVENSGQTSVASCPGDMQTDVQSQEQLEEEVNKQRRPCGLIGTRETHRNQECSNFLNAGRVVKDSTRSKFFNRGNGLKNVEALSLKRNSSAHPLKGVKRPYVLMTEEMEHSVAFKMENVMMSKCSSVEIQQKPWSEDKNT